MTKQEFFVEKKHVTRHWFEINSPFFTIAVGDASCTSETYLTRLSLEKTALEPANDDRGVKIL